MAGKGSLGQSWGSAQGECRKVGEDKELKTATYGGNSSTGIGHVRYHAPLAAIQKLDCSTTKRVVSTANINRLDVGKLPVSTRRF